MKIAIDVGGVLTDYEGNESGDTKIINVDGAIDVLTKLRAQSHNLYIVSYCKEKSAIFRTNKLKLDGHDHFFDYEFYTANKYEKFHIINHIQADIMIDDNEQILNNIKQSDPNVITILFQEFNDNPKGKHKKHLLANNWTEVDELIKNITIGNITKGEPLELSNFYTVKNIHEKAIFVE